MFDKILRMINTRSLIAFACTGVFCALAIKGEIPEQFISIYAVIITFFFVKQEKGDDK